MNQSAKKTPIYIISVTPIIRGVSKERLSYFSSIRPEIGSLVTVPVRSRKTAALVVGVENAKSAKAELRKLPYAIKKLDKLKATSFVSSEFIATAIESARYFASTTGAILNSFLPKAILEQAHLLDIPQKDRKSTGDNEKSAIQSDENERFANYKSLIREQFARKHSVFFCLPTIEEIKRAKSALEKGIEQYTYVLHGNLNKDELLKTWRAILENDHTVLVIATGSFLAIPRHDFGAIVVERESSRSYKLAQRPHADIRTLAEILAKTLKIKLIYGDVILRTETLWRQKQGEIMEFGSLKFRSISNAASRLINMKREPVDKDNKFNILSGDLIKLIQRTKTHNENLFILGSRKGLFPNTICGDCGTIVKCTNCHAAMVLHGGSGEKNNFFLCHRCGEKRPATDKCDYCQGWRLVTLGIGLERIEQEIRAKVPDVKLFRLDKDSANTYKKAVTTAEKFLTTPGSVLLGTEMALLYLSRDIDNTAVATIDSMFSIPDFKVSERILHILLYLRSLAQKHFLIQTRNIEEHLFDYALKGNLMDFYREEIKLRETFDYPPFSIFIKVTLEGKRLNVIKEMEYVAELLKDYEINIFPALSVSRRGLYALNALIKLPRDAWPDKELNKHLASLSPIFVIKVDPESLL